jgi:long-chain acyl-CoA synthetase
VSGSDVDTRPAAAPHNLADLVRASAARGPGDIALVHGGGAERVELTWAELDRQVDALAASLRVEMHLHVGDRVALTMPNSAMFVTTYFAVLRAGLVAVPINTGYLPGEMARLFGDAEVKAVFCDDDAVPTVEEAVAETHRALVDPAGFEALIAGGRSAGPVPAASGGEDLAVLLFTSGTSGRPKGAMLSHRALLANIAQCLQLVPAPVRADDVVLLVLPLFHIYGLNAGLGMVAATGARAVLVERFSARAALDVIAAERVTSIPGAPPMYAAWAALPDGDLRSSMGGVRLLASGAAPLPVAVLERLAAETGSTVQEGYGLTETAPVVASVIASPRVKPGSVGRPIPGVEVRLVDEPGRPISADDDTGEIEVRGDNLFSGYWPDGSGGPDSGGWWATGDVAYADDDGDLFLVDRRIELVLVSGFNVYPREVEDVIAQHPSVAEVAVIGVPHLHTGEAVKAYVVARAGRTLTEAEVIDHCATRLARFKRPTVVAVVEELPHSSTGKVAKGRLRSPSSLLTLDDGSAGSAGAALDDGSAGSAGAALDEGSAGSAGAAPDAGLS